MFKIMAVVGLVAGGAAFGVYHHTELYQCSSHTCSTAPKPCCTGDSTDLVVPQPCCADLDLSNPEVAALATAKVESCCSKKVKSCCDAGETLASAKPNTVAAQVALCCGSPSLVGVALACADYAMCCDSASANAAVAGPAALFTVKATK